MTDTIPQYEFVPLYDRVLVTRISTEVQTPGGLYIPDSAKEKPNQGYVIAIGNGRLREDGGITPLCVKVGDKVLFGKFAGTDIKLNDNEFLMMREEDILGIIK
jgi:chaperonin GroES